MIKNNLLKYRMYYDITQENLSNQLKISVQLIRKIEAKHYYPKYQIRAKICKRFNLSYEQMFYMED
jgi:DNA-binding XRE family transcriptional regulator